MQVRLCTVPCKWGGAPSPPPRRAAELLGSAALTWAPRQGRDRRAEAQERYQEARTRPAKVLAARRRLQETGRRDQAQCSGPNPEMRPHRVLTTYPTAPVVPPTLLSGRQPLRHPVVPFPEGPPAMAPGACSDWLCFPRAGTSAESGDQLDRSCSEPEGQDEF